MGGERWKVKVFGQGRLWVGWGWGVEVGREAGVECKGKVCQSGGGRRQCMLKEHTPSLTHRMDGRGSMPWHACCTKSMSVAGAFR